VCESNLSQVERFLRTLVELLNVLVSFSACLQFQIVLDISRTDCVESEKLQEEDTLRKKFVPQGLHLGRANYVLVIFDEFEGFIQLPAALLLWVGFRWPVASQDF
jgi:hypothetical protein